MLSSHIYEQEFRINLSLLPAALGCLDEALAEAIKGHYMQVLPMIKGVLLGVRHLKLEDRLSKIGIQSPHVHITATGSFIMYDPAKDSLALLEVNKVGKGIVAGLLKGVFSTLVENVEDFYDYNGHEYVSKAGGAGVIAPSALLLVQVLRKMMQHSSYTIICRLVAEHSCPIDFPLEAGTDDMSLNQEDGFES